MPCILLSVHRHLSYSLSIAICPNLCPSPPVLLSFHCHLSYSLSIAICPTLCPSPYVLLCIHPHMSYSLSIAICPTVCPSPSVLLCVHRRMFYSLSISVRYFLRSSLSVLLSANLCLSCSLPIVHCPIRRWCLCVAGQRHGPCVTKHTPLSSEHARDQPLEDFEVSTNEFIGMRNLQSVGSLLTYTIY